MTDLSDVELQDICSEPFQAGAFPVHTVAVERAVKVVTVAAAAVPVHTVAVERAVKVVTGAASAVLGEERRHGWITSRLEHRRQLPSIASKQSFMKSLVKNT